jgi:Fur family ferric uptake transcriptional regulator
MGKYLTRQKDIITSYLEEHADTAMTASGTADALEGSGISRSTVYRYLAELGQEGRIHRFFMPGEKQEMFRYSGENCAGALHVLCTQCGRIFHMDKTNTSAIVRFFEASEGVILDPDRTMICGVCPRCRRIKY